MQRTKPKYTGKIFKNLTVELSVVNDMEPSPLIFNDLFEAHFLFYSSKR